MIKIAICTTNNSLSTQIKATLQSYINLRKGSKHFIIYTFSKTNELNNYSLYQNNIDLVFVDSTDTWVPLILNIKKSHNLKIILLTTCVTELINFYYILRPNSFLLKPISSKLLIKEFEFIQSIIYNSDQNYIIEKNDSGIYKINLKDIIFIETYNRNTLIHIKDYNILSYKTLKTFEINLGNTFYRIHESYLVNMDYIISINNTTVTLYNMNNLNLSKHRKTSFVNAYIKYMNNSLFSIKPKI